MLLSATFVRLVNVAIADKTPYCAAAALFNHLDTDEDAKLSLAEFHKGINLMHFEDGALSPDLVYHSMNTGGSGVELDEFGAWAAEIAARRADDAEDSASAESPIDDNLPTFLGSLGLEKYCEGLNSNGVRSTADMEGMKMGDLRKVGLTVAAARKILNSGATHIRHFPQ